MVGLPEKGTLREILTSDAFEFGGSSLHNVAEIKSRNEGFCEHPYSAKIDLPPLSCVYFEFISERTVDGEERI